MIREFYIGSGALPCGITHPTVFYQLSIINYQLSTINYYPNFDR